MAQWQRHQSTPGRLLRLRLRLCLGLALGLGLLLPASAGLLEPGQDLRVMVFTLGDGNKPMLDASVAGKPGRMLFDNGTPDALFLNRDALALGDGKFLVYGHAASGQRVELQEHSAPAVQIAGQALDLPERIRSGNFAFTKPAFGENFLGFIGTRMVDNDAFVLDYARQRLLLLRAGKDGALAVAPPQATDILGSTDFLIWPGGLPVFAAAIGRLAILADIDTGDGGTFYLSPATRRLLVTQRRLKVDGENAVLSGLRLAGVVFEPTPVRLVDAGGPDDFRPAGHADQLRLGAAFLMAHPCLWNFPARTLSFLKPDSAFLQRVGSPAGR